MWSTQGQDDQVQQKSIIACHPCRRRKVKCDREIPRCQNCLSTAQSCNYPAGPRKPGPKIGSLQRQRRGHTGRPGPKTTGKQSNDGRVSQPPSDANTVYKPRTHTEPDLDRVLESDCRSESRSLRNKPSTFTANKSSDQVPQTSGLNIDDLSFNIYPCHQSCTPGQGKADTSTSDVCFADNENKFQDGCSALGISEHAMKRIICVYFDNMVAINIFHEPSFHEKLKKSPSLAQTSALLAAIAGYAIRFLPLENDSEVEKDMQQVKPEMRTPEFFVNMALQLIDQALSDCGDEPPDLCVLQALILATHCQLTQGVLGRAWRSLGLCVRLAYELNLHLLDSTSTFSQSPENTELWSEDEEKRRAWWAIWEMDVFASSIRRTPTAIDWMQMEVLLPVPDIYWHSNSPTRSCFFEQDPTRRWKTLHESGNQSPKAWFIVINSFMKDGQSISCPRGVPSINNPHSRRESARGYHCDDVEKSQQKLETLANAVHCFIRVLPDHLRYRQQYLSFEARLPGEIESCRQLHCSIYNIYAMTQLARLMIYRYDVFGSQTQAPPSMLLGALGTRYFTALQDEGASELSQYFEAADNVLTIVNRSCENHVQYINPFLSSTIWLAAAVQLVRKQLEGPGTKTALIKTRFDLLYLTYTQFASFWGAKTSMQQDLESLEVQLESCNPEDALLPASQNRWSHHRLNQQYNPDLSNLEHSISQTGLYSSPCEHRESTEAITTTEPTGILTQCPAQIALSSSMLPQALFPCVLGDKAATGVVSDQSPPKIAASVVEGRTHSRSPRQQPKDKSSNEEPQSSLVNLSMLEIVEMSSNIHQDMTSVESMNEIWQNLDLPSDGHDVPSGFSTS